MVRRIVFPGVPAAPGIGIGRVHLVDRRRVRYAKRRVPSKQVQDEIQRFQAAIGESERQLDELSDRLRASIDRIVPEGSDSPATDGASMRADHLSILEAHRMMLRDPMLVDGTSARISRERLCAEWALRLTLRDIKNLLDELADNYFRERRSDVDFVGDRILRNLTGGADDIEREVPKNAVVVAHDLSPADTLHLMRHKLAGFVTDVGGRTSHTAILARALGIPAVVAAGSISELAAEGDAIAMDGHSGEVVLHPGRTVVSRYRSVARERALIDEELHRALDQPSVTACGHSVSLLANVEIGEEVQSLSRHGAEGIGLLRTEFMFMRGEIPDFGAHLAAYLEVLRALKGLPLTVRTFDMGGDKIRDGANHPHENNPALGLRAVRYCLRERELFVDQLRGILAASAHGPIKLLLPMISGVAELREVRALLDETREALRREGVPFDAAMPVGIMIELPSAVWVADLLAAEVDFFSVGTNDLTQYTLAADRDNEQVAYLYRPLHTSVLRALDQVSRAARAAGIPLAVCGEMASEPTLAPVLLGLGFTELSMHASAIPRIKRVIRSFSLAESEELVQELLQLATVQELEAVLAQRVLAKIPETLV